MRPYCISYPQSKASKSHGAVAHIRNALTVDDKTYKTR